MGLAALVKPRLPEISRNCPHFRPVAAMASQEHHSGENKNSLPRWTLSVHTLRMEIKHCKRCGQPWCYRGEGRPLRCGKCKSPYWDRPRKEFRRDKKL